MEIKKNIKLFLATIGGILIINSNVFADTNTGTVSTNNNIDTVTNPCNGILSISDRPSKADSALWSI